MRTFVQLKDGIGFAFVNTTGETDGIEVASGTGEQYLTKKYENGVWSDAPVIWFAEINNDGNIIELKKTFFSSEIGNLPILTPDVKPTSRWVNGAWEHVIDVEPIVPAIEAPQE